MRGRGRPRKGRKDHSIDRIYTAVVDAAEAGANLVISEEPPPAVTAPPGGDDTAPAEADATLPAGFNKETEQMAAEDCQPNEGVGEQDEVPPLRLVVGAKRPLATRTAGRKQKKRRKMTPRKIVKSEEAARGSANSTELETLDASMMDVSKENGPCIVSQQP